MEKINKIIEDAFGSDVFISFWSISNWTDETAKVADYLLSLNDREVYYKLWNEISYNSIEDLNNYRELNKECCSPKVKKFLAARFSRKIILDPNINVSKDIATDRLVLTKASKKDFRLIAKHFKIDGDFELYSGSESTKKQFVQYSENAKGEFSFVIKLKKTNETIGFCSLIEIVDENAMLCYYIFKPFRRVGYASEAVIGLIDAAYTNKLERLRNTDLDGIYNKKAKDEFEVIKAKVFEQNIGSRKMIEQCNFIHTGYEYKWKSFNNKFYNVHMYYLSKEDYTNGKCEYDKKKF